jgi:hypothetical protein
VSDVANKLDEARALIERGWTQGDYVVSGCFCASGAIGKITVGRYDEGDGDEDEQDLEFRNTISALGKAVDCEFSYEIARWNDAPERTQAEVIDAFKRAAELARAGEQ